MAEDALGLSSLSSMPWCGPFGHGLDSQVGYSIVCVWGLFIRCLHSQRLILSHTYYITGLLIQLSPMEAPGFTAGAIAFLVINGFLMLIGKFKYKTYLKDKDR